MSQEAQAATIAATLAAMAARSEAHQARDKASKAQSPAERAYYDQQAAEADAQTLALFAKAREHATEAGATRYAETMGAVANRITPTDPTADTGDALAQAAKILNDESEAVSAQMAPLYEHAARHVAKQLHDNSAHDPDAQKTHEIYAVHLHHPENGPDLSGSPSVAVRVSVVHLRSHEGDLVELLNEPAAALNLARVHPTHIVAVVAEGHAYPMSDTGQPDRTKPQHSRAVVMVTPFGMLSSTRLWDATARTWSDPAERWIPTDEQLPDENLPRALGNFYAVQMVAAQVLSEAEPDDN